MELALWPLTLETRCPFDILRSGSLSIGCSVPGEIYLFTDVATAMCPVNLHVICISLHFAFGRGAPFTCAFCKSIGQRCTLLYPLIDSNAEPLTAIFYIVV